MGFIYFETPCMLIVWKTAHFILDIMTSRGEGKLIVKHCLNIDILLHPNYCEVVA